VRLDKWVRGILTVGLVGVSCYLGIIVGLIVSFST